MKNCQVLMNQNYKLANLSSNAYRIKEMGDGFLCSVGFPFRLPQDTSMEQSAYQLALDFIQIFQEQVLAHFSHNEYFCSIGIARGSIEGYFPKSGIKEYDLFGEGIIHATRYENMRKKIVMDSPQRNILILQESVYIGLSELDRSEFHTLELTKNGLVVRDDPTAAKLYYRFISTSFEENPGISNSQLAV